MATKLRMGLGPASQFTLDSVRSDGFQVTVFSGSAVDPHDGLYVQATVAGVDLDEVVSSQGSVTSYHPTLFENFDLSAIPTYNFYTVDEQTDASVDQSASLGLIPRYVTVSWNRVPNSQVLAFGQKRFRPGDPRFTGIGPVLDVFQASKAVSNGYLSPGTVFALIVPPPTASAIHAFDEDAFLASDVAAGRLASAHIDDVSFSSPSLPPTQTRIRVNFVDPSIGGTLDQNRISVANDHVHLASLASFSKLAAGLEVISEFNQDVPTNKPPPKFPAPHDSPTLQYIGYVLERHTLDPSGSMVLSKTVHIDDPTQTTYVDREVTYGTRYAYRIRSIVQWSRPLDVNFGGESVLDRVSPFNPAAGSPQKAASFYAGSWSDWSRTSILDTVPPDPPEEIFVRPVSPKGIVDVAWKMPGDPQRDLRSLHLLRSSVRAGLAADWVELGQFVPGNGRYVDSDVRPFEIGSESYVYAMYATSYHGETSTLSEQIEARLTRKTTYSGEEPNRQFSPAGGDPSVHPGSPPTEPREILAHDRIRFYVRGAKSSHPLFGKEYVVEVRSLSTGERVEVSLSVETADVGFTNSKLSPRGKGQAGGLLLSPAAMIKRS